MQHVFSLINIFIKYDNCRNLQPLIYMLNLCRSTEIIINAEKYVKFMFADGKYAFMAGTVFRPEFWDG